MDNVIVVTQRTKCLWEWYAFGKTANTCTCNRGTVVHRNSLHVEQVNVGSYSKKSFGKLLIKNSYWQKTGKSTKTLTSSWSFKFMTSSRSRRSLQAHSNFSMEIPAVCKKSPLYLLLGNHSKNQPIHVIDILVCSSTVYFYKQAINQHFCANACYLRSKLAWFGVRTSSVTIWCFSWFLKQAEIEKLL